MTPSEVPSNGEEVDGILKLLEQRQESREETRDRLLLATYKELRAMARGLLRSDRSRHFLCATELVHDTYLRLFDQAHVSWRNRAHFFGSVASTMRRVLIDYARRRKAEKRVPLEAQVSLDTAEEMEVDADVDRLLLLDQALTRLARVNPRQARIAELRHLVGLTESEVASALEISRKTVGREWRVARLWLYQTMIADRGSARRV